MLVIIRSHRVARRSSLTCATRCPRTIHTMLNARVAMLHKGC